MQFSTTKGKKPCCQMNLLYGNKKHIRLYADVSTKTVFFLSKITKFLDNQPAALQFFDDQKRPRHNSTKLSNMIPGAKSWRRWVDVSLGRFASSTGGLLGGTGGLPIHGCTDSSQAGWVMKFWKYEEICHKL